MSLERSSGPSDCLQLCTAFSERFVRQALRWLRMQRCLVSSCWASQVEKHKCRSSVFYTDLYRILSPSHTWGEMPCDCFAVRPPSAPLGILRSADLALMTWIVSQLCFYLCVLQPSPGLQNSRESEVVAAHSSSVTWKCSCMKQTAPRGPTAVVDTPTETPLGCIRTLAHL